MKISGIGFAVGAAILFGVSTPLAKSLLGEISPILLAGLLYLSSGLGLSAWLAYRGEGIAIPRADWPWLAGAIGAGGVVAPVLLMVGLAVTPAATATLLLNLEGVATALLAWLVFKENTDARIIWGMVAIIAGGLLLSWNGFLATANLGGSLAIAGACLGWGIDNNLTRKVSTGDPVWIAAVKGCVAGVVNCGLGLALGAQVPSLPALLGASLVGFLGYGVSLTFFILALRDLGAARTGAYFGTAPFIGAVVSVVLLREPLTLTLLFAGALMGLGVWLHLTEDHAHEHDHEVLEHDHEHVHDAHHQHAHDQPVLTHRHTHRHEPLVHRHSHYPDIHHRHSH